MYTIKEALDILNVSKVTIYKHMSKNGIEKGKKLTKSDIEVLEKSISKTKKVDTRVSVDIIKKEYTYKINELQVQIDSKTEQIEFLERDNRELIKQLQDVQIMANNLIKQNTELLSNNQKLLEKPKGIFDIFKRKN